MKRRTLVTWLLILIALPWPVDYWRARGEVRKDRRNEELFRLYDCGYYKPCAADFDGDGVAARFDNVPCEGSHYGCLVVNEGGREALRLPYNRTDNTFRTHLAVRERDGATRLLVYDGVGPRPPRRLVFAWGGGRLYEAGPDALELEILDAMAAYDDTGTLDERIFRDITRVARFVVYYLLLLALAGITLLWGRLRLPDGPPPHTRDSHWLLRGDR